jgi:hypothetical protein
MVNPDTVNRDTVDMDTLDFYNSPWLPGPVTGNFNPDFEPDSAFFFGSNESGLTRVDRSEYIFVRLAPNQSLVLT